MTRDETLAMLADILGGIAPESDLATDPPDADLREALDLDSIDFTNLVTALHERTGLPIPESDYPRLMTIERTVAYFA